MCLSETYSNMVDGCNFGGTISTGVGQFTNTAGQFEDNYTMSVVMAGCASNSSCTVSATQTIYVDFNQVASWPVVFGCSGVTVNGM